MRPKALRFAEQWLDEQADKMVGEDASAKEVANLVIRDGEAQGIPAEEFDDDNERLLEMILTAIDRR